VVYAASVSAGCIQSGPGGVTEEHLKGYSGPRFQDNSLRWCLRQKGAGNERKEAQKFYQPVQDKSAT
jgi:hypothetical protein